MPNVIDSLVVELALDARKLNEQTRQALDQFNQTKEAIKSQGDQIEAQGKRMLNLFGDFKRVALGVSALFLGGMGIKEFATHMFNLEAATGRVARTMDVSAAELSIWQGAAQRMGNTSEGITGTLQGLSSEMNKFMLTGQTSMLGPLTQLGVSLFRANGQLKTSTELFRDITKAIEGMDPARARAMLTLLGFDQGAINMAIEGQAKLAKTLDETAKALHGGFTDDDVRRAQEYQAALRDVEQSASTLGRTLLTFVAPALVTIANALSMIFQRSAPGQGADSWIDRIIPGYSGFVQRLYNGGAGASTGGASGGDNWSRFLGGLSFLETNQRNVPNRTGSSAMGYFQFLNGTAAMATGAGLADPRAGSYADQSAATRAFIEKFYPAAAEAIARGDYATAERMLNKVWPSLPGGSQMQSPDRYRAFGSMLAPGARHSSSIDNSRSSSSSTKVDIGAVHINAPGAAKSADSIASEIGPALKRQLSIAAFNSGQA